jgi:hypothetical protein
VHHQGNDELIRGMDALNARVCASHRQLLALIAEADRRELWPDSGARDLAHWLGMRYGISWWKASRWIQAAHALQDLPLLSEAFSRGEIGIDKVVELTRFATLQTESRLIRWAQGVSVGAIRHKGDLHRQAFSRPKRLSGPGGWSGGTSETTPGSGCPRSSPRPRGRWWPGPWSAWPRTSR